MKKKEIIIKGEKFVFRLLRKNDRDKLELFFKNSSDEMKKTFSPKLLKYKIEDVVNDGEEDKLKRVVVLNKNEIIGYVVLVLGLRKWERVRYNNKFNEDDVCTIAPCMNDKFQNMGIGTKAVEYTLDVARHHKKLVVLLWGGVTLKNKRGISFYKNLGFRINKKWLHPVARVMSYDMYMEIGGNGK